MPQSENYAKITHNDTNHKMAKTENFIGKNIDLERLATRIENYLTENKFQVGFSRDVSGDLHTYLIQARKAGFLRTASGSRRSTDITLKGSTNNFEASVGTGEWGKNLVTSAPLFVVPIVGIAATITKLYTAKKFEDNLWSYIKDQAKDLQDTKLQSQQTTNKEYSCDYEKGYSEWSQPISGGKMTLEYQKGQSSVVFKMSNNNVLKIPAQRIEKAEIVTKKTKSEKPDRMIQITFKDPLDHTHKSIFNFNDDVIRGALAGIDELVSEAKLKKIALTVSR